MKHILRIPTKEQYAYIEMEFEGTPEEAFEKYRALTAMVNEQGGAGLASKEWNEELDSYLETGKLAGGADTYAMMSRDQQMIIQAIKLSKKRVIK